MKVKFAPHDVNAVPESNIPAVPGTCSAARSLRSGKPVKNAGMVWSIRNARHFRDSKPGLALLALPLGLALCPANAAPVKLGEAANFAVLSLGKTVANAGITSFTMENDPTTINGNVGFGPLATAGGAGDRGTINGNVLVDSTAAFTQGGILITSSLLTGQSLTQASQDALDASTFASTLPVNINAGAVNASTTFTSQGQQTVIAALSFNLFTNGDTITIDGGPDDEFIFNVSGGFHVAGADINNLIEGINLTGGVTPNHVLFNIYGPGTSGTETVIIGNARTTMNGTFLAPLRAFNFGHATINGAFIGSLDQDIKIHNEGVITQTPFSSVPEPSSLVLAGGLLTCGLARRRRPTMGVGGI